MVFVNRYYLSKEEFSYKNIFHEDSPFSNQVTLSVGISSKRVNNSHELNNLIIQADEALYTAKKNGRNSYVFYE